jgi:Uma2 family endonuclease
MNVALRTPMTLEAFLAWEERQELRYEFDGFQPVAMTGGTAAHSAIQTNLITALKTRLRGKPCQPHGSHLKIEVVGRIRYPDAFIVCTPLPPNSTVVTEPVVVFEILSPSTIGIDMIFKNAEYRATPSIKRYVILEQTSPAAMVFYHKGEDWVSDTLIGPEAILVLPDLALEIPLAEIYADIDFTQ